MVYDMSIVQKGAVHIVSDDSHAGLISPFPVGLLVVLWKRGKTTGLISV